MTGALAAEHRLGLLYGRYRRLLGCLADPHLAPRPRATLVVPSNALAGASREIRWREACCFFSRLLRIPVASTTALRAERFDVDIPWRKRTDLAWLGVPRLRL
jgi:hypothetical protein